MMQTSPSTGLSLDLGERLHNLVNSSEVLRLIHDITTCTVMWDGEVPLPMDPKTMRGLELFPCFTLGGDEHYFQVKGTIFPNLPHDGEGLSHLIRLEMAGQSATFRLATSQTYVLSPFHLRFLSVLFGRLVLQYLVLPLGENRNYPLFTPYSLEEQVVAGYLQSLRWAPCATIKLDSQDNPYIGSMLNAAKNLRRCELPGGGMEVAIIRAWRLFKRLLYYSIEGGRL